MNIVKNTNVSPTLKTLRRSKGNDLMHFEQYRTMHSDGIKKREDYLNNNRFIDNHIILIRLIDNP